MSDNTTPTIDELKTGKLRIQSTAEVVYAENNNKYLYLDGSPVPENTEIGIIYDDTILLDENIYIYEDLK